MKKVMKLLLLVGCTVQFDEVDIENKTIVLDIDGVYLTFELAAIKTVLPIKEAITPEGAVIEEGSAIED